MVGCCRIKEIVQLSDRLRDVNMDVTLNPAYLDKVRYIFFFIEA